MDNNLTMSALGVKKGIWGALGRALPAEKGRGCCPSLPDEAQLQCCVQFWALQFKKDKEFLEKVSRGYKDNEGSGGKDILTAGIKRLRPDSSLVLWTRSRGNRHKLKHSKFCINRRKMFFTLRLGENLNRLPRETVEFPFLEILKTLLDEIACNLSSVNPL